METDAEPAYFRLLRPHDDARLHNSLAQKKKKIKPREKNNPKSSRSRSTGKGAGEVEKKQCGKGNV